MKRQLDRIAGKTFDVAIIGGGIVGAFVACDASRRGLSVLLLEAKDFGMATSEAMSHLVHGGLRYLAQGQLSMVMESLAERNRWLRFAPHHVSPQPFLLPLKNNFSIDKRIGLGLFEMFGKAAGGIEGALRSRVLSRTEAAETEPALAGAAQGGAILYNDARVDSPERAVLSLLLDATSRGAIVANHCPVKCIRTNNGHVTGLDAKDALTGDDFYIDARIVVNCAGAFADRVSGLAGTSKTGLSLTRSKGIHVIASPITKTHALALSGKGEHAFVVPVKGYSLIGTTDDVFEGEEPKAEEEEQAGLVKRLHRLLPGLEPLKIVGSFAGVRALSKSSGSTYRASRDIVLVDHGFFGCKGLFSLTGGKWTTARRMAEKMVDRIAALLERPLKACDTTIVPLSNSPAENLDTFLKRFPTPQHSRMKSLYHTYGAQALDLVAGFSAGKPGQAESSYMQDLENTLFNHAFQHEMAVTSDDLLHRIGRFALLDDPDIAGRAAVWFAQKAKLGQSVSQY
jgi:glycerol-3-phosphate dehydrogenase